MMETSTIKSSIRLPKPIKGVRVSYFGPEPLRGSDVSDREQAAYRQGQDDAQTFCQQQIMEAREEMRRLQDEVLSGISTRFDELCDQFNHQVPELVLAIVRKVLAGVEPGRETVIKAIEETLAELAPQSDTFQVHLHPKDASLLREGCSEFSNDYPGMELMDDPSLAPGDVVVRSRFGIIDGRVETKLRRIEAGIREVHQ